MSDITECEKGGARVNTMLANRVLIVIILGLTALRFHPAGLPSIASTYLGDFIIFTVLLVWFAFGGRIRVSREVAVLSFLLLLFFASITLFFFLLGTDHLVGTVTTFLRITYYVGMVVVLISLHGQAETNRVDHWLRLHDILFFANLLIVLLQLLDPPFLGELIRGLYGTVKLRSLWTGYPRVYGAFNNANWFGVYLVFCGLGWLAAYKHQLLQTRVVTLRLILLGLMLVVSGSRTALLGLVVGLVVSLVLRRGRRLLGPIVIVSLITGVMVFALTFNPFMLRTLDRFFQVFTADTGGLSRVGSVSARIETWGESWDLMTESPLYGYGDPSLSNSLVPHNSYLTWLLSFGFLGLVPVFAVATFLWRRVFVRRAQTDVGHFTKSWFTSFTAALSVMAFTADFVVTSQVMLLWFVLLALVVNNLGSQRTPQ